MTIPAAPTAGRASGPSPWETGTPDDEFCRRILPHVSRTFALSISMLPEALAHSVTVAYLLCRIADTIEDDPARPPEEKRALLFAFAGALEDGGRAPTVADAFQGWQDAEEGLAASASRVLGEFHRLPAEQRRLVRPWIQEMCAGMADTVDLLASREDGGLRALGTLDDLRRYCYYVAGTVGHLLTDLFQTTTLHLPAGRVEELHRLAHGFGLGLQMTNIIKDVRDDRERGVSFVPAAMCVAHGIDVREFGEPGASAGTRAVVGDLLLEARHWLDEGLAYCAALPVTAYGIRRFCLSALFLAARTLRLIERTPEFPLAVPRLKVSRAEVSRTVLIGGIIAPVNPLVRAYYQRR